MKNVILIFVLFVQNTASLQDNFPFKQHEIGINLGPFLLPAFVPEYGLKKVEGSFVTNYKNQFSLRLKIAGIRSENYNHITHYYPAYRIDSVYNHPNNFTLKHFGQV